MKSKTKTLALVVCTALCLSSSAIAQGKENASGVKDQIKALLNQSRQAVLKGDTSYLEKNAAEDYSRVGPDGKRVSKSDWVNAIKSGDVKLESIEISDVKVRVYGNAAVATYADDVKGTNKGQDISGHNQITRVFVKQAGKWQEVAFHSTRTSQ
jgi:ketosteroid isomerase-like protein